MKSSLRRLVSTTIAAAALALAAVAPVSAHGVSPAKLTSAGWECFNVPVLGVHCLPPGHHASTATLTVLYFDTDNVAATDAPFSGTELLLRQDLYRGQPCPQEDRDTWTLLPFGYYACHHK